MRCNPNRQKSDCREGHQQPGKVLHSHLHQRPPALLMSTTENNRHATVTTTTTTTTTTTVTTTTTTTTISGHHHTPLPTMPNNGLFSHLLSCLQLCIFHVLGRDLAV
jgi:hypothetical protein